MHRARPAIRRHTVSGTAAADSHSAYPVAARTGCSDRNMAAAVSAEVAVVAAGHSGPGCNCTTWQQLGAR